MSIPKREDPDAKLVSGCMTFGTLSVGYFFLTLWPFFVYQDTYRVSSLTIALGLGVIPAFVVGAICCYLFDVVGAGSLMAGMLTFGVFFFLRHLPMVSAAGQPDVPQFDYPHSLVYLVPILGFAISIFVAMAMPRKRT